MNTQNPAQTSALSAQDERVQPDSPLSGEVKRGGASFIILHDAGRPQRPTGLPFTFWREGDGFLYKPHKATRFPSLEAAASVIAKLRADCPHVTRHWNPASLRAVNPAAGRELYADE